MREQGAICDRMGANGHGMNTWARTHKFLRLISSKAPLHHSPPCGLRREAILSDWRSANSKLPIRLVRPGRRISCGQ
jgi:hypothetical protein